MSLRTQIKDDIKLAMKAKDVQKRDALRLLDSAIKQIEIDERRELSDKDVTNIIMKQIKQRNDAALQYKNASREDLMKKELDEIAFYEPYLPTQLSDNELLSVLQNIITKLNAQSIKDMGKVMGMAKSQIGSQADGKRINECVKTLLK